MAEAEIKWFTEAKVNIAKNCNDRHLIKEEKNSQFSSPMTLLKKPCISLIMNCINAFANGKCFA
jgi:hypothetical protein